MLRITALREQKNWSKSELARRAVLHVSTISLIENGRMQAYPGQAAKIAAALEWKGDPADLFKEVESSV